MQPFIGRGAVRETLKFPKCEIYNCVLEVEFKLTEAEGHQGAEDSGDEEQKEANIGHEADGKRYEDEVRDLRRQLDEVRR